MMPTVAMKAGLKDLQSESGFMAITVDIALKLTPACARMVPLKTDLLNEWVKQVAFSG